MIRVCSGWNPKGAAQYGDDFLRTFDKRWPKEVELQVYTEVPQAMPRDANRLLWDIPGAAEFHDRHADNRAAHGLVPQPRWKHREVQRGYSFRHDAYKFWKQILIPEAAAEGMADGDILIWLDGDTVSIADISVDFIERLVGDHDVVFLGREPYHSEIGFWAVRLGPQTREFLHEIAQWYRTDCFTELPEWHSAFIWDTVRKGMTMKERNLCRKGARGHVFPDTVIGRYIRHDKGPRKGATR